MTNLATFPLQFELLSFLDWEDRSSLLLVNRRWASLYYQQDVYRFFLARLNIECGVYSCIKVATPPTGYTWKSLFYELYSQRLIWHEKKIENEEDLYSSESDIRQYEKCRISVYARFRPKSTPEGSNNDKTDEKEITLPLHQRLAMIKLYNGVKSNKEALEILTAEGGWFNKKWENISNDLTNTESESDSLVGAFNSKQRVPFIKKTKPEKITASVQSVDSGTAKVVMLAPDVGLREFTFDGVLPDRASQSSVYETVSRKLVSDFVNGYNGTIIAYGQTSSGKTHTMFGDMDSDLVQKHGIIPRICSEVLTAIDSRKAGSSRASEAGYAFHSSVSMSYIEVYGDQVFDLLKNGKSVGQSKVSSQRYVLNGNVNTEVHTIHDIINLLTVGDAQKRKAATAMNDRSSRAHSIIILTLHQTCIQTASTKTSRLFLADLGGSENVKKSLVEAGGHKLGVEEKFSVGFTLGEHLREAVYINLGLLSLKKCIEALNMKYPYVPYQDSKLTMILSEGLSGNSKTSIIVCGNMDSVQAAETMSTMRFGEVCRLIETNTRNSNSILASVLADLDSKISHLESEIKRKERWEVVEKVRTDELAEENTFEAAIGGKEIQKISVLVGAEVERKQLEELLIKRSKFTGEKIVNEDQMRNGSDSKSKKVISFGKSFAQAYGFGEEYREEDDKENNRFIDKVVETELPKVIKERGAKQWSVAPVDAKKLEANAKKVNRSKLVYSGISA